MSADSSDTLRDTSPDTSALHHDGPNCIILLTTYPNDGRALKKLIIQLLKQKLAGCIQRVNYVKSYYLREGKIKQDEKKLLIIKTTATKKEQLIATLKKQHPYDTPEIICVDPDQVDEQYLQRLGSVTS